MWIAILALAFVGTAILITLWAFASSIREAWRERRRIARSRNVLMRCPQCDKLYPEDPLHPGYVDLHVCLVAKEPR